MNRGLRIHGGMLRDPGSLRYVFTLLSSDVTPLIPSEEQREVAPESTASDPARTKSIPVLSPAPQGPPLGTGNGTGGGSMVDGVNDPLLPSSSRGAAGPGSAANVKQPQMLARQPSKKVSRKPSAQDTRQEGSGGVPTRDVQAPPPLPPLPPPTIGRNERPSHKAVGGGTTDESPLRPPLSTECMYPAFPPFTGLKPIGRQTTARLRTALRRGV